MVFSIWSTIPFLGYGQFWPKAVFAAPLAYKTGESSRPIRWALVKAKDNGLHGILRNARKSFRLISIGVSGKIGVSIYFLMRFFIVSTQEWDLTLPWFLTAVDFAYAVWAFPMWVISLLWLLEWGRHLVLGGATKLTTGKPDKIGWRFITSPQSPPQSKPGWIVVVTPKDGPIFAKINLKPPAGWRGNLQAWGTNDCLNKNSGQHFGLHWEIIPNQNPN